MTDQASTELFVWKLLLPGPPGHVVCSLVRAASAEGRVCSVLEDGRALIYVPRRSSRDSGVRMRARVMTGEGGSLVHLEPAPGCPVMAGDVGAQAAAVASLVRALRGFCIGHEVLTPIR